MNEVANRRRFLIQSPLLGAAALGAIGARPSNGWAASGRTTDDDGVTFHYEKPYDFDGIMQGFPPPKNKRITLANFRADQANRRWSHQHMREIFPTQEIPRGIEPPRPLQRKIRSGINDIEVPFGADKKTSLGDLLQHTHTDAFLVLCDGKIITEQYYHGMEPSTLHNLWSVSKSLSVGVVANLLAKGIFEERTKVADIIKEWQQNAYRDANVRHLMDMQSGVLYDYEPPEMPTWVEHTRYNGTQPKLPSHPIDEGEYDFLANHADFKKQIREHGELFYYKESDARGIIWLCERKTGRRFVDLFSEFIWSKIGAEHNAYVCCDGLGSPSTNGRISTTLRDLARWGQMHLDAGHVNGIRVLPKEFITDIRENADPTKITDDSFPGPRHGNKTAIAYRSQYWIPVGDDGDYMAAGYNGQWCYIHPKHKTVIVKFSTYADDEVAAGYGDLDLFAFKRLANVVHEWVRR